MELLSVTMNDGVKMRSDIEGKDNSSEDKSNYKIVRAGDMVYNSMRMWQGANGISPWDGIVSPAYTVLQPKQSISNGFFAALFKIYRLVNEFRKNSQGMTSDTWNLKYPQISPIKIAIPSLEEQNYIAAMLSHLDSRIEKQRLLVEHLKKYKRGLLSSLFAQKLDSNIFEYEAWIIANFDEIFYTVPDKPFQVQTNEYFEYGTYEVVDQGKKKIVGYNDSKNKLFTQIPAIVYGDHTTTIKYRTIPFIVGGDGVKLLKCYSKNHIGYMYYALCHFNIEQEGYKRHFSILRNIKLPIPPLYIQEKIYAMFSKLDVKIEEQEEMLSKLNNFKKGILQKMFI